MPTIQLYKCGGDWERVDVCTSTQQSSTNEPPSMLFSKMLVNLPVCRRGMPPINTLSKKILEQRKKSASPPEGQV